MRLVAVLTWRSPLGRLPQFRLVRWSAVVARREYESAKGLGGRLRPPAWFRPRPLEFSGEPVGPFPAS
jgi:hypothetical protein